MLIQEMSYMMRHYIETHHRAYCDFLKDKDIEENLGAKLNNEIFNRNKYNIRIEKNIPLFIISELLGQIFKIF